MLLRREPGGSVVAIGQASHAWISGQLAAAWTADPVSEELRLAAEQHDVGMAQWDLRPELNPDTGLPYSFSELPRSTHVALWDAAAEKLLTQSRHAALLVSLHGTRLYDRFPPAEPHPAVPPFLERQRALQERWIGELGLDRAAVERDRALLGRFDELSLALCLDWDYTLDPWPFGADELELRCDGRRLTGTFADQAALDAAWQAAEPVGLRFSVRRPGAPG